MSKTKYAVIAVVLIIIVIGALIVIRGSQRRLESQNQIDEASALIEDINMKTGEISSSWKNIERTVVTLKIIGVPEDTSGLRREIEYSKEARNDIADMKDKLDSIQEHHDSISKSLQKLEGMELPDWIYDYVDFKSSMIEKDGERADVMEEILDNTNRYYQFSEQFMEGLISQIEMEENLEDGTDKFSDEDYLGARESFEKALVKNSEVEKRAKRASNLIDFKYFERIESNRKEAEEVIDKFIQVFDLVDKGSYEEANTQYIEAEKGYDSLKRLYPSDLMPEHQTWWMKNIDSKLEEVRELTKDIEELESQINELVEQQKTD